MAGFTGLMCRTKGAKGRDNKYDPQKLIPKVYEYAERENFPSVVGFCYENRLSDKKIYEAARGDDDLRDALDVLLCKKKEILEKGMASGSGNVAGLIFLAKQLGYRDNPEQGTVVNVGVGIGGGGSDVRAVLARMDTADLEQMDRLAAKMEQIESSDKTAR